jgi:hypothetical protein
MIKGDGGRTLRAILDQICNKWTLALAGWAIDHVPHIEASRDAYRARA